MSAPKITQFGSRGIAVTGQFSDTRIMGRWISVGGRRYYEMCIKAGRPQVAGLCLDELDACRLAKHMQEPDV